MRDPLNHPKPPLFFGPVRFIRCWLACRKLPGWTNWTALRWAFTSVYYHYCYLRRSRRIWQLEKLEGYHADY